MIIARAADETGQNAQIWRLCSASAAALRGRSAGEAQALNRERLQKAMSGKSAGKRMGQEKNKRRIFGNAEKISYLCGEKRNNI
ncbi:MAG: hypothetical protein IKM71_01610 [Bacteroidaceae bacterium]|nr:hypothetical protein [Bacteroidaceae bacterium]